MKTIKILPALLVCLALVFLCACGKTSPKDKPAPALPTGSPLDPDTSTPPPADEDAQADSASDSLAPYPFAEAEAEADSAGNLYTPAPDSASDADVLADLYRSPLGFSLAAPGTWYVLTDEGTEALYAAEETEDAVRFYDIRNAEAGCGGTLVTIRLFAPGEDYDYLPDYELLAETEQGSFVAVYPTDVQADPDSEELLNHHLYLCTDLAGAIRDGFRLS